MAAGFLFKGAIAWPTALLILGTIVTASSFLTFAVQFSPEAESEASNEFKAAVTARHHRPELVIATA